MAAVHQSYPPIPYGMADFSAMRREGFLYVDKTRFLRELENERHVFLLRPRRFGKSWDERLARQHPSLQFTGIALVFRGWELVAREGLPP